VVGLGGGAGGLAPLVHVDGHLLKISGAAEVITILPEGQPTFLHDIFFTWVQTDFFGMKTLYPVVLEHLFVCAALSLVGTVDVSGLSFALQVEASAQRPRLTFGEQSQVDRTLSFELLTHAVFELGGDAGAEVAVGMVAAIHGVGGAVELVQGAAVAGSAELVEQVD
jgi:hypothetical protein